MEFVAQKDQRAGRNRPPQLIESPVYESPIIDPSTGAVIWDRVKYVWTKGKCNVSMWSFWPMIFIPSDPDKDLSGVNYKINNHKGKRK